jgi:hypothetical protein
LIEMQEQYRIFHWQTKTYAQHEAFGKTYDALADLVDNFMEVYMGWQNARVVSSGGFKLELLNLRDADPLAITEQYAKFLSSLTQFLKPEWTDLLNIRDEMLAVLNKLRYLLTLT